VSEHVTHGSHTQCAQMTSGPSKLVLASHSTLVWPLGGVRPLMRRLEQMDIEPDPARRRLLLERAEEILGTLTGANWRCDVRKRVVKRREERQAVCDGHHRVRPLRDLGACGFGDTRAKNT
jgi:hypothetical protein